MIETKRFGATYLALLALFVPLQADAPPVEPFSYVSWKAGLVGQSIRIPCHLDNEQEIIDNFAALYEANHPGKAVHHEEPLIPKTIHQIWIGGPLPEKYKKIQATWKAMHPDWEYKLWTDADAKNLTMQTRELFEKATNIGQKADILRCEVLYQFGGLYLDMDFECLKPFDELHHCYTFYTGFNHLRCVELANGLMACSPGHPLMKRMIENISVAVSKPRDKKNAWRLKVVRTSGPAFFTKQFSEYLDETGDDSIIAFPTIYFYPAPGGRGNMWNARGRSFIKPQSYGIHYFGATWRSKK